MKKLLLAFIYVVLIYYISVNHCFQLAANTENQTIEVLLDGIDSKPLSLKIGELDSKDNKIELWHHSGKYWSYKGLQISDNLLEKNLRNEEKLEEALSEKITFEIPLDQNIYNKLKENKNITIYCSSILTTKTNENIPIKDLFYDKPVIELKTTKYISKQTKTPFFKRK